MTDEDGKYNGWKNRETWAVNLHLTNNEGDYRHFTELARECKKKRGSDIGEFASLIKKEVEDIFDAVYEAAEKSGLVPEAAVLMAQDLNGLDEVDWFEVAKAFMDE